MQGLIQRVSHASVTVDGNNVGAIERGLLLLLGVEREDNQASLEKLLNKVLNYRLFPDDQGKMNLSVQDIRGGLLVISQFTLAADTRKGLRPSFTPAAEPELARQLYERFVTEARQHLGQVACGVFAADMQVNLCNDGPVTFLLKT